MLDAGLHAGTPGICISYEDLDQLMNGRHISIPFELCYLFVIMLFHV